MNFALPAVMIILGLLPGIVFFKGYFSGRFPKRLAAITGVAELALYVVFAVPIDWLALRVVRAWFGLELDFLLSAKLLLGPTGQHEAIAESIRESWTITAPVYFGVLVGAFLLGNLIRKLVWVFRLDLRFPFFRMRHEWYYVLLGRAHSLPRSTVPFTDVLVEQPGGTQLYQGVVSSFEVGEDGNINQLILRSTYKDQGPGVQPRWRKVEGDRFVIAGPVIQSINMRYIIPEPPDIDTRRRDWRAWRGWGVFRSVWSFSRRFWLEEP